MKPAAVTGRSLVISEVSAVVVALGEVAISCHRWDLSSSTFSVPSCSSAEVSAGVSADESLHA